MGAEYLPAVPVLLGVGNSSVGTWSNKKLVKYARERDTGSTQVKWNRIQQEIGSRVEQGDFDSLYDLTRRLNEHPELESLEGLARRGQLICGIEGAVRFLGKVDDAGKRRGYPRRIGEMAEDWGAIAGHRYTQPDLAKLAEHVPQPRPNSSKRTRLLYAAIQERVFIDGTVDHPDLVSWWADDALPLTSHPWERGLVSEVKSGGRFVYVGSPWPEGVVVEPPDVSTIEADLSWGLAEH